ncbi:Ig-like domain-containing protein [Microbacterium sp. cx-59]|uniref:Ig-like domain-containing protein n=1 Tax=Microbacterium sp. cx-59 TaxID=2891207 RepID=UPI001E3B0E7B|nr:Ig-like domain-containing protein [Microbacterium sp. cx-59]MCC4906731.1 Ig-like domain-containing protein [Microbacterium sp. cx-59]
MSSSSDSPRIPRRTWIIGSAITAVLALVVTLAAVWPGFDAQQTPPDDGTIWAMQSGEGRRYARVNTTVNEIDTVKQVENPSGLVQNANRLFVYAEGDTRFADVDMATPVDLDADAEDAFQNTPAGTVDVVSQGDVIVYRTDGGAVYASSLSSGATAISIDPYAEDEPAEGEDRRTFVASAVAVGTDGTVYAYSGAEQRVIRADAVSGRVLGTDDVTDGPAEGAQLSAIGDSWALLDTESGALWVRGRNEPLESGTTGGVLQRPTTDRDDLYIADTTGLVAVPRDGSAPERADDTAQGTPAAPAELNGVVYGAWLPDSGGAGTLWSSENGASDLDYRGGTLGDEIEPEFVTNGSRMILNETRSGWVWTLPDGELVPSSQEWNSEDDQPTVQQDEVEAERVIDPKPPVAVNDAFGVRAGRSVVLPVMLNDHDPNEDVLSVVAASVEGLDPAFGTVGTANEQQELVVRVSPEATGTATFRYRVTDGTTTDGLTSEAATVTLTVAPDTQNSPPVWCGVEGCLSTWPNPQVVPGGTVAVNVLEGWVDPDGDPIYVSSAVNQSGIGSLALDPQGTVTFQHPNPNATEAQSISIAVTVSDSRGQSADKPLEISVTPSPQLTAQSFAAVGSAGQPTTIDVRPHVTGVKGGLSMRSANTLDQGGADIAVNSVAGTFQFSAPNPGSYLVQYVVADEIAESTGTVRITLVDPAQTQISTPPLTAFVRPGEDATVDVISAVANPAGLVLLASDVQTNPDASATLTVDLVGQSMLRVAGATDNGQPGVLGVISYTVSDGTGNGYTTTSGEVTVVLLPAAEAEPPIAVDDAVTVRAGTQIDIPVLDNDTAPAGALFAIDASAITNESGEGLAFATGRLLRYLAPSAPGSYAVGYTIYRMGFPDMTDTATVTVTVLPDEANTAPVPRTLVGRVLSGSTVSIPFDRFAVDPDGDAVTLDRIVAQPERGSATVSAEGDAIVYTSNAGDSGQVSFTYQVRDAQGATGTGEVRVGVLDAEADPSPVTYSDYLQVQANDDGEAVVRPADNDIDPSGSSLEVIDVRPNAEVGTAEYRTMEEMLDGIDANEVRLLSGTQLGTYSFAYTVRNGNGDTAIGLIVLKVVRDPVPDYPVIRDTTLTVETREDFPDGVDVLSGKVSWSGGDAASLSLSLWNAPDGIEVDGRRISGRIPERTLLIPFQVTGTSFDGREVTSYGFLRVPGTNDLQLTLRNSAATVEVDERASVDIDMQRSVALPAGTDIEIDGSRIATGGARAEAGCALTSGTTVRYTAGAGAPWRDTCTIPVRLVGQDDYTFLTVQVQIIAEDPQPELRPASLTVSPGSSATYDLTDMTTWAGTEDWAALSYGLRYSGDQFTVEQAGSQVTVTAKDASRPGRQEPVTITLPSHPDTPPATLALTVGPAPSTLPKGASLTQTCSQSAGNSCTINVIGAGGEVNPLPGTPLRLISVGGGAGGSCTGVTFSVASATALQASWAADAEGTRCTVGFTVEDAQGRQSSGDRNGQVTLDLQGYPKAPNAVTQTAFGDKSITLRVDAGAAGNAYPALQGFRIFDGGQQVTTCASNGVCQPFTVGANGDQRTYEARAYNSVGDSRAGVTARAWAYRSPTVGQVTAEPIYQEGRTSNDSGVVRIRIQNSDPEVRTYEVTGAGAPVRKSGSEYTELAVQLPVGGTTITVTPTSNNEAPDGSGSVGSSGQASVNVAGLPRTGDVSVAAEAKNAIRVSDAPLDRNGSSRANEIIYVAVPRGADFSCSVGSDGTGLRVSGGQESSSSTISGLQENREYTVGACVSNGFGAAKTGTATGWAWNQAGAPVPQNPTYEIPDGRGNGNGTYLVRSAPNVNAPLGYETVFFGHQGESTQWQQPAIGAEGSMQVKFCVQGSNLSRCGAPVRITAADASRAKQVQLADPALTTCVVGSRLQAAVGQNPGGLGTLAIKTTDPAPRFYSEGILGGVFASELDPDPNDPLKVPNGTSRATARLAFTWTDPAAQYGTLGFDVTYRGCTGSVAPEPTPTNTPPTGG